MTTLPEDLTAETPLITNDDIDRIEGHLGVTFDRYRRDILRSNESFDVQACPGSGKTTLLVAKLALLAERWPSVNRGICVISVTVKSHTH